MDKKANRDKRKKNLSHKPSKYREAKETQIEKESKREISSAPEDILPNNWSKYVINDRDDIQEGADFETLLQEPVSYNSHFKFKSEQNWDADIKSQLELNNYFTLDLKLIGEGISTIPFPKRHNYNENLFTSKDLESIKKHSEINNQKYKKFLEKKYPTKSNQIIIRKNIDEILPEKSKNIQTNERKKETIELPTKTTECEIKSESNDLTLNELKTENVPSVVDIKPKGQRVRRNREQDEVDELLNLTSNPQSSVEEPEIKAEDPLLQSNELQKVTIPTTQHSTTDLEQWLDDILDD